MDQNLVHSILGQDLFHEVKLIRQTLPHYVGCSRVSLWCVHQKDTPRPGTLRLRFRFSFILCHGSRVLYCNGSLPFSLSRRQSAEGYEATLKCAIGRISMPEELLTTEQKHEKRIAQLKARFQNETASLFFGGVMVEKIFKSADEAGRQRLIDSAQKTSKRGTCSGLSKNLQGWAGRVLMPAIANFSDDVRLKYIQLRLRPHNAQRIQRNQGELGILWFFVA